MADDLLKLMQQWLTQMNQGQSPDTAGSTGADWSALFNTPPTPPHASVPPQHAELLTLLTRQSIEFTRFAEQMLELLDRSGSKAELSLVLHQFHDHLRRLTQEWILKRWQLPEQLGALFRTHSFQDDLLLDNPFIHGIKSLMNSPALLGLNHQLQQELKTGVELLIEYEQALASYSGHYADINRGATRTFLTAIENASPAITGLGQLHDLWVEAYERCYAAQIHTPEYQDAHGRISNAVMALRLFLQTLRNQQLQQLGIPNSEQLDLLAGRLNTQRKQIKELQRTIQEISSLRAELDALKTHVGQPAAAAPSAAPAAQPPADSSATGGQAKQDS